MRRSLILVLGLMALSSNAKAENCSGGRYEVVYQSDVSVDMLVRSGARCGSRFNGRIGIDDLRIAQAPSHGKAFVVANRAWGYQSNPGFVGQDEFAVEVTGTSYRKGRSGSIPLNGSTRIDVKVQVTQ